MQKPDLHGRVHAGTRRRQAKIADVLPVLGVAGVELELFGHDVPDIEQVVKRTHPQPEETHVARQDEPHPPPLNRPALLDCWGHKNPEKCADEDIEQVPPPVRVVDRPKARAVRVGTRIE